MALAVVIRNEVQAGRNPDAQPLHQKVRLLKTEEVLLQSPRDVRQVGLHEACNSGHQLDSHLES
jgi:hypothetical protein